MNHTNYTINILNIKVLTSLRTSKSLKKYIINVFKYDYSNVLYVNLLFC